MLTRLKISGFKNLMDVDIRFGTFTCIAGANGVGKSNLFDAIRFLSLLADRPLMDAVLSVRDESGRTSDVRSIFHHIGDRYETKISFEAEMIVPERAVDDLGQEAVASITFLKYKVSLAYRAGDVSSPPGIELVEEELTHINKSDAKTALPFKHTKEWRDTIISGQHRAPYFISTSYENDKVVIKQHQDGGNTGRPLIRLAATLPRTVLSVANASEMPTALLARREMQSWRLLQLEPSAMRQPNNFTAPIRLGVNGANLASTLYHLARTIAPDNAENVYAKVANRLSELLENVRDVGIDRDEKRELLTLQISDDTETIYPARALSDGTLRFIALAVLELDVNTRGLICLEEPENGIHPIRIPSMLRLLQDIACDTSLPVDNNNPLRQVIINTHSPSVVKQVPQDSLIIAEKVEEVQDEKRFEKVSFGAVPDTWRVKKGGSKEVTKGVLLDYLNPDALVENRHLNENSRMDDLVKPPKRLMDRTDLQSMFEFES
ncbi:MAG: AAA family ATPase [Anaerolineae bacterium]|nr:AAA family ATPase [Anaerolineae bacterium]